MRSLRLVPVIALGLALTAFGFPAAAQVCAKTPTGRVSWFPFGGSSVDLVRAKLSTDDGGVASAPGHVGDGYLFDGTNDRVLLGNPTELALTSSLSIEAWVRVDVANSNGIVIFRGEPSPGLSPYYVGLQNGALVFHLESDTSTAEFVSPNPLPVGTFTHVAATLDNATGDVHLYVDGSEVLASNTSVRPFATVVPGGGVVVGSTIDGGAPATFLGLIDELSTYSSALTPTQVQSIYAAGPSGTCGSASRIWFTASSTLVEESVGTVQALVFRTGGQAGAASVSFQTADGTATEPADYTSASGSLNWGANDVSIKTITVSVVNDSDYETTREAFQIKLSGPTGATLGNRSAFNVQINGPNDQPGTIELPYPSFNGYEDLGAATITVTRKGGSAGAASVNYSTATGGTATLGQDYNDVAGTLNWPDGDMAPKSFNVPLLGNLIPEGTETVALSLSSVTGALPGPRQTAILTIYDSPGKIAFSPTGVSVNEGDGTATLTVGRLEGRGTSVSVDWATVAGGSAVAGSDYTPASGQLVWGYGELNSKTISIPILNDGTAESPETIQVELSNVSSWPTNNATLGAATATVTINDDDVKGRVAFTSNLFIVGEGAGNVVVSVTRSAAPSGPPPTGPSTVTFVLEDVSAQSGFDYGPSSTPAGTLFWTNGELGTKTITIPILQDTENEGNQEFRVRITAATGDTFTGAQGQTQVRITDDDPAGRVSFTTATQHATEAAGTVTVTVRRTLGSAGAFEVDFVVNPGSASSVDGDYGAPTPFPQTITFADGDTANKVITIPIIADGVVEVSDETFTVQLTTIRMITGTASATLGSPFTQTVIIDANSN